MSLPSSPIVIPSIVCISEEKGQKIVACSRALRKKWLDLVSAAMGEGRKRAIEIEKLYWAKHQAAVRVTPSGKILDGQGKQLMPIAISAVTSQV